MGDEIATEQKERIGLYGIGADYLNLASRKIEVPHRMDIVKEGGRYVVVSSAGRSRGYSYSGFDLVIRLARDLRNFRELVDVRIGFDYKEGEYPNDVRSGVEALVEAYNSAMMPHCIPIVDSPNPFVAASFEAGVPSVLSRDDAETYCVGGD